MSCSKQAKTYEEQLGILKGRGLLVLDDARAIHCLAHHNYYRLSAYRFPLTIDGNPDRFLPGVTFDDVWNLYHFDRTLRSLVSEAVKRLEISMRSRWAYTLAHTHGPQAYETPAVFHDPRRHTESLARLDEELNRSDEIFVGHYRNDYKMSRPPIWVVCEVMSFGLLSRFFENMRFDRDKKAVSSTYGFPPDILKSLLTHCVYIRNMCAHHARLWNRRFTITVSLPHSSPVSVLPNLNRSEDRRLYNTLILLGHVVRVVDSDSTWPVRLKAHLLTLRSDFLPLMGCPSDWASRPAWQDTSGLLVKKPSPSSSPTASSAGSPSATRPGIGTHWAQS
jgi:abortive infection bacteriophage resistance protein